MPWTRFMDMHSGGGTKEEPYEYIFIEAPKDEAITIFYNRFGHSPERVTCTCCGEDYSIHEGLTLEQATAWDRGCAWNDKTKEWEERPSPRYSSHRYEALDAYRKRRNVLIVPAIEITDTERRGEVPQQGYVWVD